MSSSTNLTYFHDKMAAISAEHVQSKPRAPQPLVEESYLFYRVHKAPLQSPGRVIEPDHTRLESARIGLFRLLVLIARATPPTTMGVAASMKEDRTWMTWIGTLAGLVLSSPASDTRLSSGFRELPMEISSRLADSVTEWEACDEFRVEGIPLPDGFHSAEHLLAELRVLADALNLPPLMDIGVPEAMAIIESGSVMQRAAYFALVVYLSGRPVTTRTEAISSSRPGNLQAKFNNNQVWVEIGGDLKMAPGSWAKIGRAWSIDPTFRAGFFTPLIGLTHGQSGVTGSIIGTMVSLLDMAQLSHVRVISDFLKAYPWVAEMEEFSSEIHTLRYDVDRWNAFPAHIRPYAKLIHQDQFKAFDSRSLERLTRLAVDVMSQSITSLAQYAVTGADQGLRELFDRELTTRRGQVQVEGGVNQEGPDAPVVE